MGVLFGFLRLLMLCIVSWCNITVASSGPVKLGPSSNVSKNLYFPDFRLNSKAYNDIKLLGSASLAEDLGIIQIPAPPTDPEANISFQAGRAIFSSPVRLFDPTTTTPASFHTTFSFQIDRTATSKSGSDANGQGGSGLTFILVPDEVTVGRPGPWLGMLNDACEEDYKTFAVEFDTYRNEEFGDPNDNHVGINLGSIVSNTTIDAADADVSFKNGSVVRAWINYDGNRKWIDLSLGKEKDDKPSKTVYAAPLDLSSFLTEYMFVGFSASTGRFTQIHNILSWNFSSTSKAYLRVPTENACERKLFLWGRSHRKPPSAFLIFVAVVVLCLIALLSLYCNRKPPEKLKTAASALPGKKQRPRPPHKPRRFSMSELSLATRSFSEGEILGYGERGIFFKGTLQNGSPVAIKRFSPPVILHANLDRRKILKEIGTLSRLRHPNLAPIRGWCVENKEMVLVYEYMSNGSLDKWLFARGVLPSARRFKVVKDIAEALCFLHHGWDRSLLHKNVKISNVLLDITFTAVLGDFGLIHSSKNCQDTSSNGKSLVSALDEVDHEQNLRAPESSYLEIPNEKIDVFGFGVIVLEILSGRRSLDQNRPKQEVDLVAWAWNLQENEKLIQLVDRRLGVTYNPEQAICLSIIGLLCTLDDPRMRPSMEEVIWYINGEKPLPTLPSRRPTTCFLYPSATELCNLYSCSPRKKISLFGSSRK
ncbi:L-type lectin-domain containing receptor kinase VIII.2 [Cryptomeria japonica]|uniref:L-type lectin-domain containing receptor kinase VIII.2 n=1 Tax=Cryptomeria japonica TaxID=3369 RepID=UPI0027DA910C|nr:L-type lectin-domain containing receptor kinase VIII.2 [Cryptomeria japonica]